VNGFWDRRGGFWEGVRIRPGLGPAVINGRWTRRDRPTSRRTAAMRPDPVVQARMDWSGGEPQPRR
jgi:hypothetical protein